MKRPGKRCKPRLVMARFGWCPTRSMVLAYGFIVCNSRKIRQIESLRHARCGSGWISSNRRTDGRRRHRHDVLGALAWNRRIENHPPDLLALTGEFLAFLGM